MRSASIRRTSARTSRRLSASFATFWLVARSAISSSSERDFEDSTSRYASAIRSGRPLTQQHHHRALVQVGLVRQERPLQVVRARPPAYGLQRAHRAPVAVQRRLRLARCQHVAHRGVRPVAQVVRVQLVGDLQRPLQRSERLVELPQARRELPFEQVPLDHVIDGAALVEHLRRRAAGRQRRHQVALVLGGPRHDLGVEQQRQARPEHVAGPLEQAVRLAHHRLGRLEVLAVAGQPPGRHQRHAQLQRHVQRPQLLDRAGRRRPGLRRQVERRQHRQQLQVHGHDAALVVELLVEAPRLVERLERRAVLAAPAGQHADVQQRQRHRRRQAQRPPMPLGRLQMVQRVVVPPQLDQHVADVLFHVRHRRPLAQLAEDRQRRPVRGQRVGQAAHRAVDRPEVVGLLGRLKLAAARQEVGAAQAGQRRRLVVPAEEPQRRDVPDLRPGDLQRQAQPHEALLDGLVRRHRDLVAPQEPERMRARPQRPGLALLGPGRALLPEPRAGHPERQLRIALLQAVDLSRAGSPGCRSPAAGPAEAISGGQHHRHAFTAGGGESRSRPPRSVVQNVKQGWTGTRRAHIRARATR